MPLIRNMRLIHISAEAFKALSQGLKQNAYSPKTGEGVVTHESTPSRFIGDYIYRVVKKLRSVDKETLQDDRIELPVTQRATFAINATKGLLIVTGGGSHFDALEMMFGEIEGARFELEQISAHIVSVFKDFRNAHARVDLRSLRIKDYQGRQGTITTANFKLMEPHEESNLLKLYDSQIVGFGASVMTEDGRQTVTIASNGRISASENFPSDLVEFLQGQLAKHNQAVEVETVEV